MPRRALLLAGGVVTAGCASGARTPPAPPPTAAPLTACRLVADSTGPVRTASAAFEDSADAARARRAAGVVTPLRRDCEGRPLPGLAAAWSRDSSGRYWTLELRPQEGDSLRWTAGALAATWRADPDARAALSWAGMQSLVALDARRLVVGFGQPRYEPPAVFADLALGVAVQGARPAVEPVPAAPDLRDAVDQGPDVIVTSDPDVLDYARQRPGVTMHSLPWSREYLLLLPPGGSNDLPIPPDTVGFRAGLARDAVRVEARPAEPAAWDSAGGCPAHSHVPPTQRTDVVVYPAGDPVARGLAERLVALSPSSRLAARGLAPETLATTLQAGGARAFVVAVPARAAVPCRWTAGWPDSATIVPLVETRVHAVLRRGSPALVSDWDATLRVEIP
jgi:hypothetical protein